MRKIIPNKRSNSFVKNFLRRLVLILLSLMIVIHLVVFIFYSEYNKRAEAKVNHHIMVQQVIDLINQVIKTNPSKRSYLVDTIDIPNTSLSLTDRPIKKIHFQSNATESLLQKQLGAQKTVLEFSYELDENQWLNLTARIVPTSWRLQLFLLFLEIIILGAVFISAASINRFAKPLAEFRIAAERLGIDLDQPPLTIYGPALVQQTAEAMNKMQKRIRDLIRERTQMFAALSHDLRTPITRMKLRAQFITDEEAQQKMLDDLNEMEQMISETLLFLKNQQVLDKKSKFDLNSLLTTIVDDFKDMGGDVTYQQSKHRTLLLGRPLAIKRTFINLIDNALKYGGSAQVKLVQNDKSVIVTIDDKGPGLPPDQLEKVFTPFYRLENSRSRKTGGTGLGLAVARDIIRAHDGHIQLSSPAGGGLRVSVELPLEK